MKNKTLFIDRQAFCDWYFDDDIIKEFFYDHGILGSLKSEGKFSITLEDIFSNCGYLPVNIVAEGQKPILDESSEVDVFAYDKIIFKP